MSYSPTAPVISTANATNVDLAAGATYTGSWERAPRSMVLVQTYADQPGTLYLDFAVAWWNGVSADETIEVSATANQSLVVPQGCGGRFFRLRYTNDGAVAQTVFRIEATYSDLSNYYGRLDEAAEINASYLQTKTTDPHLDTARGLNGGQVSVNKFGRATDCDLSTVSDIWDRANSADAQDIFVAPTQARIHQITSTSANDTSAGTGAQAVRVYGLTDWDTEEETEIVVMNGASNVATLFSYVIIHRIQVLTFGSAGPNVGIITATADTDATITAQINADEGQTQMAIYGVPSTQKAYMTGFYASLNGTTNARADITLKVNPYPDNELAGFLTKHTIGIGTSGSSLLQHHYKPYNGFDGPCIIKIQGDPTANNTEISAGFDLILVTK